MSLAKYTELINQYRLENGALIAFEYQYPQPLNPSPRRRPEPSPDRSGDFLMSPTEVAEIRAYFRKMNAEIDARLASERALVCRLNDDRTRLLGIEYLSKGEASEREGGVLAVSNLLDLDYSYGGALRIGHHLFFSEDRVHACLIRHDFEIDPVDLVHALIDEGRPIYTV